MSKINLQIHYPTFIESIVLYFLLRHRKKHKGFAFRCIRLMTSDDVDKKYRYALVDPDDYQKLSKYPWQLYETEKSSRAAVRYYGNKIIYMHRQIMNAPKGTIVDHKNRESLDNTRRNLRFATPSQNACNTRRRKGCSRYRGVRFEKHRKKWRGEISYNRKRKHLGYFNDETEAARAYDEAARVYHGEFAVLNFPQQSPSDSAGSEQNTVLSGSK
ncbi:MAG: HNH endonuclease [Planctomycetes bacterium]|nr:HNH endonuclease [Planctomycetota bacterium]MBU1518518.1 HNH endonuclease [Planctomycetota bacterium]MBU2458088.1 HNH endonuclease [Planctomycetota bacterium]